MNRFPEGLLIVEELGDPTLGQAGLANKGGTIPPELDPKVIPEEGPPARIALATHKANAKHFGFRKHLTARFRLA